LRWRPAAGTLFRGMTSTATNTRARPFLPASRSSALLASIVVLAVVIRIALLVLLEPRLTNDSIGFRGPTFVPLSYRHLALAILNWDFSADLGARAPGYPAFMALSFRIFGLDNWSAIVAVQSLLGVGVFFIAYALWSQLYGRGTAAVLAAATAVFDPSVLSSESLVLSETLSVFLLLFSLWMLVGAARRVSPLHAGAAGLSLAWLALTRPAFQLLVLPFVLYLALRLGSRLRSRAGAVALALLALTAALPVVAWSSFNYARFGYFTPMTTQGFILTSHSAPIALKMPQRYPQYADIVDIMKRNERRRGMTIWVAYPEIMQRRNLSFAQASRLMQEFSTDVLHDQPVAYAKSVYAAFRRFWDPLTMAAPQWEGRRLYVALFGIYRYLHTIGLLLFLAIACVDIARIRRWREPGVLERLLIVSIVVLVCLASTVPIAVENARYRIPLLPLMWGVVVATVATVFPRILNRLARASPRRT
jgi:4-amino-4-deoxy-L-arabinose transferase-like glycosyltransferase